MPRLEWMWEKRNRKAVLMVSAAMVLVVAFVDWWTQPFLSLGFLYLFPIMLAAGHLRRGPLVLLGLACAVLAEVFSFPSRSLIRLSFESLALVGCGLFVAELVRNRRLTVEAQERLRILVETSPAAIVTIDEHGFIELANRAATELIAPRDGRLTGHPIAAYLPGLHHALRRDDGMQFRTAMQCRGHRDDGESFLADVWFSTYKEGAKPKLAAIIGEVSEETPAASVNPVLEDHPDRNVLNSREIDVLRGAVQGLTNKEIAARIETSESTVKNTFQQLFTKTGVRTRSQLVRIALERYRKLL
jgi:two-component system sensor kinase FixL